MNKENTQIQDLVKFLIELHYSGYPIQEAIAIFNKILDTLHKNP